MWWPFSRKQPETRADAAPPAVRSDGSWVNLLTGLNVAGRDKRLAVDFTQQGRVTQEFVEQLLVGDDMARRGIETPAREMMRQGWDLLLDDDADKDTAEGVADYSDRLDGDARLEEGLRFEAAFGGGAIFVGADDGQAMEMPLALDRIKTVKFLTGLTPRELYPTSWYGDPNAAKYGEAMTYRLQRIGAGTVQAVPTEIHESRLIIFPGRSVSRWQRIRNLGWGQSDFDSVLEPLRDFHAAWSGASALLADFSQAVMGIYGLGEKMAAGREDVIKARLDIAMKSRSMIGAMFMDTNDSFERKTTPVAGLPELLDRFSLRLAAAWDQPVSLLMGQGARGMNATGEGDRVQWYDYVAAQQKTRLTPRRRRLVEIIMAAKDGPTHGQIPEGWTVRERPLQLMTEKEKAEIRLLHSQADTQDIQNGTITPEEASGHYAGDEYSPDIVLDMEARDAMAAALPDPAEVAAAQANAQLAAAKAPPDPVAPPKTGKPAPTPEPNRPATPGKE